MRQKPARPGSGSNPSYPGLQAKSVNLHPGCCSPMLPCKHETLEYVGDQKTDEGVNSFYKCKTCGTLLVVTPARKVIGIPGAEEQSSSVKQTTQT